MSSRRRLIFVLHRVLPKEEMDECYNIYLALSPQSLDHFLRWLRKQGAVISLDELLATQRHTTAPAAAVTFDDGWEDNHRVAFPIMQSHGIMSTVYLATRMVGSDLLFPEEALWHFLRTAEPAEKARVASRLKADAGTPLLPVFKELRREEKLAFLSELPGQDQRVSRPKKFMDWDQVKQMRDAGHTFGSHTAHHAILPVEDDATVNSELALSRQDLREKLGTEPSHFAFPSGRFDRDSVAAVRAAGYKSAVTTTVGAVRPGSDPFLMPRLPIDNTVVNDPQEAFSASRVHFSVVRGMAGGARDSYRFSE